MGKLGDGQGSVCGKDEAEAHGKRASLAEGDKLGEERGDVAKRGVHRNPHLRSTALHSETRLRSLD